MNTLQRSSLNSNKKSTVIFFTVLILLFIIFTVLSVLFGSTNASILSALKALFNGDFDNTDFRIYFYIRLPRVLAAILSGVALAVSGVIIQAVLANPMAGPNLIGVNSGGGLAAILMMAIFPQFLVFLPMAAFVGALGACLIIYFISVKTGAGRLTITLVGLAVGSILTAGINAVKILFPNSVYDATVFIIGGLSGVNYSNLFPAFVVIALSLSLSLIFSGNIDVLSFGEDSARALGLNVKRSRLGLLMLASALAGAAVSFSGLIGFVGLLVPHITRRFISGGHFKLIIGSALGGAVLMLACDLLSRLIFAPYEIPVGIILSLIGGPFFIALIFSQRKRRMYD